MSFNMGNQRHVPNSDCLKGDMVEMREVWKCKEMLIIEGRIFSQCHQYSKKALEHHCPWTIMIRGSTPTNNMCVIPPIQKAWPFKESKCSAVQMSLQWLR